MMKTPGLKAAVKFKVSGTKRLQVFPRANIPGRVFIHDEESLFIAPLVNLSAGGIFVDHLVGLKEGSEVRVVVKSPRLATAVQATGTVVRVQHDNRLGLAVEFTSISSAARDAIQNCVFESKMEMSLKVT